MELCDKNKAAAVCASVRKVCKSTASGECVPFCHLKLTIFQVQVVAVFFPPPSLWIAFLQVFPCKIVIKYLALDPKYTHDFDFN